MAKYAKDHPQYDVFWEIEVNGKDEDPLYTYLKKILTGFITP